MTPDQRDKLDRLGRCVMMPGSWDRIFVRSLLREPPEHELSEKQAAALELVWHRYRRQWQ